MRRRLPLVLGSIAVLICGIYSSVNLNRHADWGYGPRYELVTIVPLSIFTGVALAAVVSRFRLPSSGRPSLDALVAKVGASWRFALATGMIVYGTWVIGSLLYPVAMTEIRLNSAPFKAIEAARLRHAVAVFTRTAEDPADLTQNLASHTNPDVVYLIERSGPELECGRRLYADRKWYRVSGSEPVQISPLD
jgi:hypothetical protein